MTTEAYWEVAGTNIQTLAFNVETKASRLNVPPVRGENQLIPYRPGRQWVRKYPDERLLTLSMWVIGQNEDGTVPANRVTQFNNNWDKLVRLFYRPWTTYNLVKQWRLTAGLFVATATAEYASGLDGDAYSETGALFNVTVRIPDAYFFGAEQTLTVEEGDTETLTNLGHDLVYRMTLELNGPLTNPVVENLTRDLTLSYEGVIDTGETVTINVEDGTAELDGDNVMGLVTWSGDTAMFHAVPGANSVKLTADAGTGDLVVSWNPPYV